MKHFLFAATAALAMGGTAVSAQSASNGSVRVQPGFFCAQNKCVRFSDDLSAVSIQARRAVSVASYDLASDPVISIDTYREIYRLALRQRGVNGTRN
ncbi:hypothetical protein KDD17_08910 [Sulfitobacter albidus]|uniref:Uncharacterized protein n=1 Tax=Sulfitobacter albidus TaxID=2829501 RepID=A0A975JAZ1_9RHOB|nr:hypothetical protein [Sulfitobacter albidus]QUJ75149.1 hypothetical protein KDD17_08910 [Sulfitobacter albidus]